MFPFDRRKTRRLDRAIRGAGGSRDFARVDFGALIGPVKNRLKVLRAERDWSQAELGGRLGVSRQAVNAIETGKHDPSLPLAFKIGRLFEMQIEEIFDDGDSHD